MLAAARPLADMLWARESEAGPFETPERRAAFEARLIEVTAAVGDETVRRYYRQDFAARLRQLFAPAEIATAGASFEEQRPVAAPARRLPARFASSKLSAAPRATWRRARSLRQARCIAAIARRSRAARR